MIQKLLKRHGLAMHIIRAESKMLNQVLLRGGKSICHYYWKIISLVSPRLRFQLGFVFNPQSERLLYFFIFPVPQTSTVFMSSVRTFPLFSDHSQYAILPKLLLLLGLCFRIFHTKIIDLLYLFHASIMSPLVLV